MALFGIKKKLNERYQELFKEELTQKAEDLGVIPDASFESDFDLSHPNGIEYDEVMDRYFETSGKIENLASVLYNLKIKDGPKMDELISLCYQNIDQWEEAKAMWLKFDETLPKDCEGFSRLAIIYDQQKKYEECLKICMQAIDAGLQKQRYNTRIARLIKKLGIEDYTPYEDYLFE